MTARSDSRRLDVPAVAIPLVRNGEVTVMDETFRWTRRRGHPWGVYASARGRVLYMNGKVL